MVLLLFTMLADLMDPAWGMCRTDLAGLREWQAGVSFI
jgi:hypothetical protein